MARQIPVIDIFAGPGGLSEGFSAFSKGRVYPFSIALSVEKAPQAYATLLLRSFYRQFRGRRVPEAYYQFIRQGRISLKGVQTLLERFPREGREALQRVWKVELGKVGRREVDVRIRAASNGSSRWILVGGPPCQAYSLAGRSRMKGQNPRKFARDARHFLYKEYLRILQKHRPLVFVMENVEGILSAKIGGQLVMDLIMNDLRETGYRLLSAVVHPPSNGSPVKASECVVRCHAYGVPQTRDRVILLGVRSDLHRNAQILVPHPEPVPLKGIISGLPPLISGISKRGTGGKAPTWDDVLKRLKTLLKRSLRGALKTDRRLVRNMLWAVSRISSLQVVRSSRGRHYLRRSTQPGRRKYPVVKWMADARLKGVIHHYSRSHMIDDLCRYWYAAAYTRMRGRSPKLADFPAPLRPRHRNIAEGVAGKKFCDRFRVQLPKQPARTITCHLRKDGHYYIHYDPWQFRCLSVREAARVQTFPDNYVFAGSQGDQFEQVGNAVPPWISLQLAEIVLGLMLNGGRR